jgi:lauroyl/myristoyl acyltransferase
MSRWKEFRYRIEHRLCRWLAAWIPRLSRRACVRLAHTLGNLAYFLDGKGRRIAVENLECAFGPRFSASERRRIARSSYQNFARTMLDLFWSPSLTPENFRQYLRISGFDEIRERLIRESRGAVFMCVHQGNWEWANLGVGFLGLDTAVVAEKFKNPSLTTVFSGLRQISGQQIISQENSLLRLLKVIKRRGNAGMLIEQSLRPTQAATVVEGYGMEMCVPLLHAVLAERAGALLIPVETVPLPDGGCEVIAHPEVEWEPGATVREIAQRCWDRFEPMIASRPGLYLWPYKHFRYRPDDARRAYPSYANHSGGFEKLRRETISAGRVGRKSHSVE